MEFLGGVAGLIGVLITGLILGLLGKLLAPGKQGIPLWLTILVGIAAAFLGNILAGVLGVRDTAGFDWIRHALQVAAAVVGVIVAADGWKRVKGKSTVSD